MQTAGSMSPEDRTVAHSPSSRQPAELTPERSEALQGAPRNPARARVRGFLASRVATLLAGAAAAEGSGSHDTSEGRHARHLSSLRAVAVDGLFTSGIVESVVDNCAGIVDRLAGGHRARRSAARPTPSLAEWTLAAATVSPRGLVHARFVEQALVHGARTALVSGDRRVSYGELLARATRIARRLRELGVRPNERVAIVVDDGWQEVVAALGVLQSGGAYLPIDAGTPEARRATLLREADVRHVLTQSAHAARLAWPARVRCHSIDVDAEWPVDESPLSPAQEAHDLAYVTYTTGPTGALRAARVTHRDALQTLRDLGDRLAIGADDRVLALSPLSVDPAVYDVFGALSAGATVVIPEAGDSCAPERLWSLVQSERVTVWSSAPSLLESLVDHLAERCSSSRSHLRMVMLNGDGISAHLTERVRSIASVGASVVSLGTSTASFDFDFAPPSRGERARHLPRLLAASAA